MVQKLLPSQRLKGRYKVVSRIGGGSDGSVYLSVDRASTTDFRTEFVVIKQNPFLLDKSLSNEERRELRDAFERRVINLLRLSHPNIVSVIDYIPESPLNENIQCLVMKYIEGDDLQTIIDSKKSDLKANPERVLGWAEQILEALVYLHERNPSGDSFFHCDIKPENIILTEDDKVVLVDLVSLLPTGSIISSEQNRLYRAPEQLGKDDRVIDASTDLFALGATVYSLLGAHLTGADKRKGVQDSLVPLDIPRISHEVSTVFYKSLQLRRGDRWRSASVMLQALREAQAKSKGNSLESGTALKSPSRQHASSRRHLQIFLCHSSQDKAAVRKIYNDLRNDGFAPWLDEENLLPGEDWQYTISKAVRSSDICVVCLSKHSITKSGYVQKEIKLALDVAEEKPEGTIFIIPARLEPCELPERLSAWHAADLFVTGGYDKLVRGLRLLADRLDN